MTALIELPPGGVLAGLARRAMPGVTVAALKTPDDLAAARALLASHGSADPPGDPGELEWRIVVAPRAGTFRANGSGQRSSPGAGITPGTELGQVEDRSARHPVTAAFPATVLEWLVEDGDPVDAGQPLVRLQPEGATR